MQYPSVALVHFSRQDDYGHLSIIDPSNVVEDENICKAVYHDYNDPKNIKQPKKLIHSLVKTL